MTPLGTGRETPLSELLGKAREFVCRFVVFGDEHAADAVCLWIAHTHALAAADHTPYLIVSSPVKRCGKSRLMEVIEPLVHDPWALSAAPTEAVMFRRIDAHESTVLIDEVDRMFEGSKESVAPMTALLNGGITGDEIKTRMAAHKRNGYRLVDTWSFGVGQDAREVEQAVVRRWREGDDLLPAAAEGEHGWIETVHTDSLPLEEIIKRINKLAREQPSYTGQR